MHERTHIYHQQDIGAKIADAITSFMGSWPFVLLHVLWFTGWIVFRVEPFPFGLLTMIVSLEAIMLSTFIMMSQNRQAERDHKRDDLEANEITDIFNTHQELLLMNRTQLEILKQQSEILDLLKAQQPDPREEMMRKNTEMIAQIDQMLKRIRAVDKLKPGS